MLQRLGRDPCVECERAARDGVKKGPPNCDECKFEKLLPENEYAWSVIGELAPLLFSRGGLDGGLILQALSEFGVPGWMRHEMRRKLTAYGTAVLEEERKKNKARD